MRYCWHFKNGDPKDGPLDTIEEVKQSILGYVVQPDDDDKIVCICRAQVIGIEDGIVDDPEYMVELMDERASSSCLFDDPIFVVGDTAKARESLRRHLLEWANEHVEMNLVEPYFASAPIEEIRVGDIKLESGSAGNPEGRKE